MKGSADDAFESWGRYPEAAQTRVAINWPDDALPEGAAPLLARGAGRSYGDACLNDGGVLLDTTRLDRLIDFDPTTGALSADPGVTIDDLIRIFTPRGFFPPVVPGTRFVTLGGAIANDIHGKNHHEAGSFGCHVDEIHLQRSDVGRIVTTPDANPELFRATIGGLGLTGLITRVKLRLKRVPGPLIDQETIRFDSFEAFLDLALASESSFEYTVAWMDMLPGRPCRGLFMRGTHSAGAESPSRPARAAAVDPPVTVPDLVPQGLINNWTMAIFNTLYFSKSSARASRAQVGMIPFFFPLDVVGSWNRLYGRSGFLQYQCVVPLDDGGAAARTLLGRVKGSGVSSSLAVVKTFGNRRSPGILSFPRRGITIALDFPLGRGAGRVNGSRSGELFDLLDRMDVVVRASGGAVYPAKDARMSPDTFRASFPEWEEFAARIDPRFSSSFWRRVNGSGWAGANVA